MLTLWQTLGSGSNFRWLMNPKFPGFEYLDYSFDKCLICQALSYVIYSIINMPV